MFVYVFICDKQVNIEVSRKGHVLYTASQLIANQAGNKQLTLYNDQPNAQVFNLFIYLLLPYMFRAFF
jgi:hypothetical protein